MLETLQKKVRGHPELNQGPLDLQSNALPLSYIPIRSLSLVLYLLNEYENGLIFGSENSVTWREIVKIRFLYQVIMVALSGDIAQG